MRCSFFTFIFTFFALHSTHKSHVLLSFHSYLTQMQRVVTVWRAGEKYFLTSYFLFPFFTFAQVNGLHALRQAAFSQLGALRLLYNLRRWEAEMLRSEKWEVRQGVAPHSHSQLSFTVTLNFLHSQFFAVFYYLFLFHPLWLLFLLVFYQLICVIVRYCVHARMPHNVSCLQTFSPLHFHYLSFFINSTQIEFLFSYFLHFSHTHITKIFLGCFLNFFH